VTWPDESSAFDPSKPEHDRSLVLLPHHSEQGDQVGRSFELRVTFNFGQFYFENFVPRLKDFFTFIFTNW
jgi:hypothetical protein